MTTTKRKISVSPTRRMLSAISFGVFCRSAPSTSAIIRSRKLFPGSAVMRITNQSETMVVPPVTPDRSPPASRITGADSPVMALSLTEATPRTASPSVGMISPAATWTNWPGRKVVETTSAARSGLSSGSDSSRTLVSDLVARSVSARALPRPSARASAKFAKRTQSQSHAAICRDVPALRLPSPGRAGPARSSAPPPRQ